MRGDKQGILTYREGMDRANVIVPSHPQIIWGSTQLNANKHSISYCNNEDFREMEKNEEINWCLMTRSSHHV